MRLVFLDRDGVINRFPGKGVYATHQKDMQLLPGALRALRLLTKERFRLVVVSNQGSVARGLITKAALLRLTRRMLKRIEAAGGKIHKVYYCMHQKSDRCRCKKPKTLLFRKAMKGLRLKRTDVYFVGDSREDVEAGRRIGCRTILVLSGRSKKKDVRSFARKPHVIKKDLLEAARWILQKRS